jgi:hypothetical protein
MSTCGKAASWDAAKGPPTRIRAREQHLAVRRILSARYQKEIVSLQFHVTSFFAFFFFFLVSQKPASCTEVDAVTVSPAELMNCQLMN